MDLGRIVKLLAICIWVMAVLPVHLGSGSPAPFPASGEVLNGAAAVQPVYASHVVQSQGQSERRKPMQAQGCEASGARSAKPTDMRTPEATHREATVVTGGQWAEPGGTRPSGTANTRLPKPAGAASYGAANTRLPKPGGTQSAGQRTLVASPPAG
jgi:hypothetical protein